MLSHYLTPNITMKWHRIDNTFNFTTSQITQYLAFHVEVCLCVLEFVPYETVLKNIASHLNFEGKIMLCTF
jgi:2-polyprenyl-3-methyl-5-hydroxy-6-metoxy-1,4-benzoquinol methylase